MTNCPVLPSIAGSLKFYVVITRAPSKRGRAGGRPRRDVGANGQSQSAVRAGYRRLPLRGVSEPVAATARRGGDSSRPAISQRWVATQRRPGPARDQSGWIGFAYAIIGFACRHSVARFLGFPSSSDFADFPIILFVMVARMADHEYSTEKPPTLPGRCKVSWSRISAETRVSVASVGNQ